jgi:membrane-associated phospholipid phosphatase
MEYFISHIGVIFGGACFVAIAAVLWWYLTDKNARLKRQRAEARRKAAAAKGSAGDSGDTSE